MMLQTPLFFFLGILIIALYAVERFNTPPSNRASTTAARYYSAALAYVLIYLIFYYLLTKYPHLLKLVLKAVGDVPPPDWAKDGSSTIIVALLLSILISKTPVLSRADTRLRKFLQNLAAIPFEALRLSKEIHDAPFSVPETLHGKIKDHLIRRGFEEEDVVFGNGKHSGHLWTKNAALMLKLELWEQDARFAAFMYERRGQLSRLRERYERLSGMARNCLSLIRHPTSGDNKDPMHQAITKFCSSFADQTDDLFEEICRFISQGVLKCKLTQGARRRELEDTGFKPPAVEATRALSIDQVLTLWGILLGFSLVNFILITQAWKAPGKVLLMTTMIVTIYSIAVICAVYPKERWALFRKKDEAHPPVAGFVLCGLAAVALSIPVNLFFKTLIFMGEVQEIAQAIQKAASDFANNSYPWMLMGFGTAVVTAFLIDHRTARWLPERRRRLVEGTILAVANMLAIAIVHWWLGGIRPPERVPDLLHLLGAAAMFGFIVGYMVPTWYRRAHILKEDKRPKVTAVQAQPSLDSGATRSS